MADKKLEKGDKLFEKQCKTCTSELRDKIEAKRLIDKMSLEKLVVWCNEEIGYKISYKSLQNHFAKHIDHIREVRVSYYNELGKVNNGLIPNPENKVEMDLYQLRALDVSIENNMELLIGSAAEVKRQLEERIPKFYDMFDANGKKLGKKRIDRSEVNTGVSTLFKSTSEEIRKAVEMKCRILGSNEDANADATQGNLIDTIVNLAGKLKKEEIDGEEEKDVNYIEFDDEDDDGKFKMREER